MDMPSQLRALLEAATLKLTDGDAADAERCAKAVTAIVRADRDVAELMAAERATASEHDEEALRAELRRRIARFAADNGAALPAEVAERLGLGNAET